MVTNRSRAARLRVQLARAEAADATREEELRAAGRTAQTAIDGEVERLRGELSKATAAAAAREAELVDQLGTRREEQERALEAVRARERQASEELAAARERAAALEAAAADRQQEHAAELERVTAAALAAREAELVDQLGTRREEQERELEAVRARERQASEELAAARERAAALEAAAADRQREHAAELERVTAAAKAAREAVRTQGAQLADTTDELASALEQERMRAATAETQASEADARAAAQSAEVERLRAELVQAQAALDGEVERLQVDLSNATAAAAAREADLIGQLQARQAEHEGELEAALEAARAREHEAGEELAAAVTRERERVAVLEAAVADGQREHAAECERLTQRLAETEAALTQEAARIEELRRDRNELREHVAAASDREQALHVKIDGQHHVAEAHGAELTEANERALAAERDLEIVRAEAATLREQLDEANVRIEEIHRTVVHPDVQQPERPAAQPTARDQAQAEPRNVPPECAPVASPPTVPTESMATNAVVTADAGSVVIIDAEESWSGESLDGGLITVVAPGSDAAVRLTSASAGTFMVNLAVSGALSVVAELRAAGVTTPCWGYIAAPGSDQALKLGIIETTPRPMDPDAVIGMLERHLGRGKRLLTAGADPDAFMSLRQALIRKGVSVSMAWDSNQALDLVTMSRPEVAVVDLDLPPRDGYGVVASLAALAPVPAVVLVEKDADGADRFAAAAADRRYTKLLVARHQVLTDVVKESGAPDAVAADS